MGIIRFRMEKEKTMRERLLIFVILMLATALFGEMKVNPFGSSFRFSLGSAVFFFGLIWSQSIPILLTGFCTGLFIMGFRIAIDMLMGQALWLDSLLTHLPAAFYYFSFVLFVHVTRIRQYMEFPIRVGLLGAAIDFASNIIELLIRQFLGESLVITRETIFMLLLFGIFRSFCVVGLYNILTIQHMRTLGEARRQELERLVMINTSLYEEMFYLRKSMSHMEEITRKSYELYMQLMESEKVEPSTALYIAEHVHEVKKDSQRILAGLSKLMKQEHLNLRLPITELCGMVIRANQKYAELLGKSIRFDEECSVNLSTSHVYALLSVLNNLVSNAVEAISSSGWIGLRVELDREEIVFYVTDSGPGIPKEDWDWVFQPGFTTKYDENGNPSTGIGLTHAQDIVHSFKGRIQLTHDEYNRTQFQVRIPTDQLFRKEAT
jgi:two-component system sensor histidine kinase YcbA